MSYQSKWDPKHSQKRRPGKEVPVDIIEIKLVDQAIAPLSSRTSHFREQRLYHIVNPIAVCSRELHRSYSLMATTAESSKGTAKGNASKCSPRVAHGGNPYAGGRADDRNGITSVGRKIIRSVPTDYLIAVCPGVEDDNASRFHLELCLHPLEAT